MTLKIEALAIFSFGALLRLVFHFVGKRLTKKPGLPRNSEWTNGLNTARAIRAKELIMLGQRPVAARDRACEAPPLPAGVTQIEPNRRAPGLNTQSEPILTAYAIP